MAQQGAGLKRYSLGFAACLWEADSTAIRQVRWRYDILHTQDDLDISFKHLLRGEFEQSVLDVPIMQFRLYYDGPLYSAQGDPLDGQIDKKAKHKHSLRQAFDTQLRHFWQSHPFLKTSKSGRQILGELSLLEAYKDGKEGRAPEDFFLWENIAERHEICGQKFVPLVCEEFSLLCDLDILMLRSDKPGGVLHSRDIDNRLKVLFDALRMPKNGNELIEKGAGAADEPMYVLLQDDSLISSVSVETDEVLAPPNNDDSYVRLTVTVNLRPYNVNLFNLSFG